MTGGIVTPARARLLNLAGMLAMIGILVGAYIYQFSYRELPCTLCLLQRVAMMGVAFGAAMNAVLGPDPRHYAVCLLSAIFGFVISIRQSLLHINPYFDTRTGAPTLEGTSNPPFGEAVMDLHLYVWGIIIFGGVVLAVGIAQLFREQFAKEDSGPNWVARLASTGALVLFAVAAFQTVTTFMECGFGDCPNDGGWNWWIFS